MTPERWDRVKQLVDEALERTEAERQVFLALVGEVIANAWQAHVAREERGRAERRFNDVRRLATSFLFEFHDAIEGLPGSTALIGRCDTELRRAAPTAPRAK